MKHKRQHVLSFFLMVVLIILTIASSQALMIDEEVPGSITYEMRDGYFYIKVATEHNPGEYRYPFTGLFLYFEGRPERQLISTVPDKDGNYKVEITAIVGEKRVILEVIWFDKPFSEMFTENNLFVIKISKEVIKYDKCYVDDVILIDKNGKYVMFLP